MAHAATAQLIASGYHRGLIDIRPGHENDKDAGNGSGIILWAETEGSCVIAGSAIGSKGIDAGQTGKDAAMELVRNLEHGGCVDEYLQVL